MKAAPDQTNVVDACNLEGRQERLEAMLQQLEMCEKALQVRGRAGARVGRAGASAFRQASHYLSLPPTPPHTQLVFTIHGRPMHYAPPMAPTLPYPTPAPPPSALQDYLETKRIAFPRFYFVAPADLLDILSKGSNPQAIIRWGRGRLSGAGREGKVWQMLDGKK